MADRDLEFWDEDGASFRKTVRGWPDEVQDVIGADLRRVQRGDEPRNGKRLKDFAVSAAEVRHNDGARVVYSVAYAEVSGKVFIVDAFMKDSSEGSEMRPEVRRRVETRLKRYRQKYEAVRRQRMN